MTCALLASAVSEIILGSHGMYLPLTPLTAFFFLVLPSWRQALVIAWMAGSFVDMACARPFPCSLFIMPLLLAAARTWRGYQVTAVYLFQFIPGGACGIISASVLCLFRWHASSVHGLDLLWQCGCQIGQACLFSACLMPLLVWVLDLISDALGLQCYHRAGNVYARGLSGVSDGEEDDVLP